MLLDIFYQLHEHFGVGLRLEGATVLNKRILKHLIVLDSAVVHNRDFAVLAEVRMRVAVGRFAVGSPTGMGDTRTTRDILVAAERLEIVDLADSFVDIEVAALLIIATPALS